MKISNSNTNIPQIVRTIRITDQSLARTENWTSESLWIRKRVKSREIIHLFVRELIWSNRKSKIVFFSKTMTFLTMSKSEYRKAAEFANPSLLGRCLLCYVEKIVQTTKKRGVFCVRVSGFWVIDVGGGGGFSSSLRFPRSSQNQKRI